MLFMNKFSILDLTSTLMNSIKNEKLKNYSSVRRKMLLGILYAEWGRSKIDV